MPSEIADIVVVDDNQVLLSVISEIFKEDCGYTVRTATDGFAALAQIRRRIPRVLLSDLNMPGMSGFELLSVVRRRFPEIVVIAMSGAYAGENILPGIAADAFYAKGTSSVAQLFEIVRTIEGRRDVYTTRASTPIWVQEMSIDRSDTLTVFVSCPECLRAFTHTFPVGALNQDAGCCPHCLEPVQLAVVRQSREPDETLFLTSKVMKQASESTARVSRLSGESAGRMYQP
jgi:CheY-like chemotaxis protein